MPPPRSGADVARLNAMPRAELDVVLRNCLAVPRWADALAEGRPYPDADALLARADELTAGLTDDEVRAALADHPKIGERAASGSATAAWSRSEQSGVDNRDTGLAERLRVANVEYERRFGHIYLVCASGRSGQELLTDLRSRLPNDPETEISVVRGELAKIARLRLARVMAQ